MINQAQVKAMISLMDDPDDTIYAQIKGQLLAMGPDVIPVLENEWETTDYGLIFQTRIEKLIHEIQYNSVRMKLEKWIDNGANDLLEGCLIINRYHYPDLDEARVRKRIQQMKHDIWLELNENLTAFEQIRIINHILFDIYGLSANKKNFHAPQNSYLNIVLDTGKGNPLSLSIIYSLICQQLEIPVYGVNLPNHFVLAYMDRFNIMRINEGKHEEVLFYINPFSRGSIFNRKEIEQFLKQLNVDQHESFFYPCNNLIIIKRMIANLVTAYEKSGSPEKGEELTKLLSLFPVE
ncbi:MAG TPA: transglutaminase-like domain-containing protein [Flavobacteriales bacterium]|nr:transglutaminase-like domain-containing protein [Flavobacteriales bacterium]